MLKNLHLNASNAGLRQILKSVATKRQLFGPKVPAFHAVFDGK